jgi:hypothetical protein
MWSRIGALTLLAAACPAAAAPPIAEVLCEPRARLEARLERQFRAALTGTGLRDAEAVMEIWTDPQGRWTLVQRYANGQSCILAMGADWVDVGPGG